MKRFLPVLLLALPSIAFAQAPVPTFSPADGAVDVAPSVNIVITFDQAIRQIDNNSFDNNNIDALITLVDGNGDPVVFDAKIDGPKKIITVDPTSDLADLTTYTLTIQPVENSSDEATSVEVISFTTGDYTPPVINSAVAVNNSGTGFDFNINVNEESDVYYVVDSDGTAPSYFQIIGGQNGSGGAADASGDFHVSGSVTTTNPISGLTFSPTKYYVHYFAKDISGKLTNVTTVQTQGLPLLNSSSIPGPSVGPFDFDLRVKVDEAVTAWYVVTTSATKPTADQILAGQDENGAAPVADGSFAVPANTNTNENITGLNDGVTYYVHFLATDAAGNQTIIETKSTTTPDGTAPDMTALAPADNTTGLDIATNTFTLTFDEDITTINSSATDNTHRVRLFENGVQVEAIDRDDTTLGATGFIDADGTSPVATITFAYDLKANKSYYILVGENVFEDGSGNNFAGLLTSTGWNFTTSGVTVNNATSSICSGSFQSIGNIVISESAAGDFNSGAARTLQLSLANTSEFAFSNSGVSVSGTSADITSLSVNVGLTSLTVTYTAGGESVVDNITISGLKVYATGASAGTTIIRTGGTADQDGNNGTGGSSLTYATINVGVSAPAASQLEASQDLVHCVGEDINAKTLSLVDQGAVTYNWYADESLSTLAFSTASPSVNIVSDLGLATPAVAGSYSFYVVTVSSCQSSPPLEVTIDVSANPVANAGTDKTGADAVCPGTQLTLGGNPTLQVPSAAGAYTYSWDYLEGTTEPDPVANPVYTVDNLSTTSSATYNFEVTVTDANGCAGTDILTVDVKKAFTPYLASPTSYSFTPTSPNQTLVGFPSGGVFSGVGVVQSGSPASYQFSPSIAHATDPNTLPKDFDIYYTVTSNGCTVTNYHVATFTISNSFFTNLESQYCSSEYPNPAGSGVNLGFDSNGNTYMIARKNDWNNASRFSRISHSNWSAGSLYGNGSYVRYNNELYRCNNVLGCVGLTTPDVDGQYVYENILKVNFRGLIKNYYEGYYGGNTAGATIVQSGTTYNVDGYVYNYFRFGTNANYNNCPTCNYAYPAAYLEFERPEDIKLMMPEWYSGYYYYPGDLVVYGGNVYKCVATPYTYNTQPDLNPGLWSNVTNSNYFNGQYFHEWDATANGGLGAFRSGYYTRGQFVQVNRNPTVFFNGLSDLQGVCEFDVLNLDDPGSSDGNTYTLTGNYSNQSLVQEFQVRLDGSAVFDYGGGAIDNSIITPGVADFDTKTAFLNSPGGASDVKNLQIQYKVDPGTDGSAGQACFGISAITVQVRENSTFDFDNSVVDADGSVYCYTEDAKGLRSVSGATTINGPGHSPNSVAYSGYGVSNLGNSLGSFTPGVAVDQILPGTNTQQSVAVTALYRDANLCQSTRTRTFKVNPDLEPSFTFGGRVNYCYEDIPNNFSGHFEDFAAGTTIPSTGSYNIIYRDPSNTPHLLESVSSSNMSFTAQPLYDQVQNILNTGGWSGNMNQTVNLNIIYTETLNAGKVCSENYAQPMVINPPLVLDIFGLDDGNILCRNDNNNVSTGQVVSFDGSVTGSGVFNLDDDTDFSAINPTLDATVSTLNGKATINLLNAYNAAADATAPRQVYLRYQYTAPGCTGPADVIEGFEISPPPQLDFDFSVSPANGEVFCYDEIPVSLATVQTTNVTLSGYGITDAGTGSGAGTFNPQLAYNTSLSNGGTLNTQQNIPVSARIVDGLGCANVTTIQYKVNPVPQAGLTTGSLNYCYEDTPRDLVGQQAKSWFSIEYQGVTTPHTENIGDINNPVPTISWDPATRFDDAVNNYGASTLTPADFHVYYSVADNNNCTNTIGPFILQVANQIDVSIAGLADNEIYCSNRTNGVTQLSFNPFPADASKRTFRVNGQTVALSGATYNFTPPLGGDDYTLEYVVISGNNCTNTETTTVKVLPSPLAIFSVQPACDSALIAFDAVGTNNLASAEYTWTFSDSVRTGQNLQHRFPGVSTYSVQLHVQYPAYNNDPALVCQDSLRLDQTVGPVPDMDFIFYNVCEEDQTSFEIRPDIPISTVSWDFGDGASTTFGLLASAIPAAPGTSGTFEAPMHQYASAANYNVRVIGRTAPIFGACADTVTREIAILKNWSPSPSEPFYHMSAIDGGKGFWVKEDPQGNSTWEFATAAKAHNINTAEPAWVTGAIEPYKANDISYMNSPCFDLSEFSRPVLSLKHWSDMEFSDGAVVQYSVDGGETWARLGNVSSGLDWYNRLTISANPGRQTDLSSGWSNSEQLAWATGKHSLDLIPGDRRQIRFRIAFSGFSNLEGRDGFAFNDVVIEERNRTVLVENFTNLNPEQQTNNENFKAFRAVNGEFNPDELVKLQYHHTSAQNSSAPDELNRMNPVDQNARAAFYGVTGAARAFVDGGYGQSSSEATFASTTPLNTYFSLRSLVSSPVDINIDFEADPANPDPARTLNVKATVQATADLGTAGRYNVFIAVAEQEVLNQAYVLRKFLPDASGTPLTSLSANDPAQEIYASYDMRHVTRLQNGEFAPFAVIVFVQDLETKNVLQTIMRRDGTASPEIVTGVETTFENIISLYPNPADDQLSIILPGPVSEDTPVQMFDAFGKLVFNGLFRTGEHIKSIETKSLSGGVYLIQLSTPRGTVRKKALVVHD